VSLKRWCSTNHGWVGTLYSERQPRNGKVQVQGSVNLVSERQLPRFRALKRVESQWCCQECLGRAVLPLHWAVHEVCRLRCDLRSYCATQSWILAPRFSHWNWSSFPNTLPATQSCEVSVRGGGNSVSQDHRGTWNKEMNFDAVHKGGAQVAGQQRFV
jgi:hypothetical protein